MFVGAYAHAEIRTLNQVHCQPSEEQDRYLQKRRRRYGYEASDKPGDTSRFYVEVGEFGDEDCREKICRMKIMYSYIVLH